MIKIFTHTDLDGIGSVVLADLAYGKENIHYETHNYNTIDQAVVDFYESGRYLEYNSVALTDISVRTPESIEALEKMNESIIVVLLDHHPTATNLNEYEWAVVDTESNTCGTEMFYNHILPHLECELDKEELETVAQYVELTRLYDTWDWTRIALPEKSMRAKHLNVLFTLNKKSDFIDTIMNNIRHHRIFNDEEKLIVKTYERIYQKTLFRKNKSLKLVSYKNYVVGVTIAEDYISDLAHDLLEGHPETDIVAIVNVAGGGLVSLRSRDDGPDVKEIAESFGGGGHLHASGYRIKPEIVEDLLFNIFESGDN